MHHAFHEVLDEFDVQAKRRDARHKPVNSSPTLSAMNLTLLPLHQLTFGIHRAPFPLGRVAADLRQVVVEIAFAFLGHALARLAQGSMHDEIGVSADRRREVGVVLRRQAEVADR